ncbi:uncharacterized protein A4U43_C04F6910 [Asparagus officinalis]|uniref:Transmembrane protein n=1 Tax=Asparagus officinalis TaxID=4686 RepID=A0A5P1EYV6_ASPOF|nr:uncharacterized protein LOC109839762 [Asparagus officinalis]ONK71286.1 uncharacterized protein A4U43_C04F6910 [Asparagus officinalis]
MANFSSKILLSLMIIVTLFSFLLHASRTLDPGNSEKATAPAGRGGGAGISRFSVPFVGGDEEGYPSSIYIGGGGSASGTYTPSAASRDCYSCLAILTLVASALIFI